MKSLPAQNARQRKGRHTMHTNYNQLTRAATPPTFPDSPRPPRPVRAPYNRRKRKSPPPHQTTEQMGATTITPTRMHFPHAASRLTTDPTQPFQPRQNLSFLAPP